MWVPRLIVRSVTGYHECSYDRSQYATIPRTIGRRMQRSIDGTIDRRPSRLIVHQSLIATTSRTISYDGSCHRYSPIVRDSATTRDRSRHATAAGYRSKNCRSVAPWPNRNQLYDPEIVRSVMTVSLEYDTRLLLCQRPSLVISRHDNCFFQREKCKERNVGRIATLGESSLFHHEGCCNMPQTGGTNTMNAQLV